MISDGSIDGKEVYLETQFWQEGRTYTGTKNKVEKNKEYHLKGFDNSSNVLEKQQILQSKFELK